MNRHLLHHQNIQQLIEQGIDFVSVVLVGMKGSAPQVVGAKMLVTADCSKSPFEGTVGGGKLELFAINHAKKLLSGEHKNLSETIAVNLQSDIGMTCGGVVQLYFEAHLHDHWHIAVFGAGHIAQALIPVLLTLSCHVHCIDHRQEWLDKLTKHPALSMVKCNAYTDAIAALPHHCYIVSVTQGHSEDVKILERLLQDRMPPYLGVIGSQSKAVKIKKELQSMGIHHDVINQIHCPIGLAIGSNIPAEIAISITAQLIQVRDELVI
jgi:xanthine dehydrogenase accessory factor